MKTDFTDRADQIFHEILSGCETSLRNYIEEQKSEEHFLDFKRSENCGDSPKLQAHDRNNFAKALSGFANSEGGVLVWGVDCSRQKDGPDVAHELFPIKNGSSG